MKGIQLWIIESGEGAAVKAVPVKKFADTETERKLADLFVTSLQALLDGLLVNPLFTAPLTLDRSVCP